MFLKTADHFGILINTISKRQCRYLSELKCTVHPFCCLRSFSTSEQVNNRIHNDKNGMHTTDTENHLDFSSDKILFSNLDSKCVAKVIV